MEKTNIFKNALYVYSQANKFNKSYKFKLIFSILLRLLIPVFATFIPTVVVYLIINGYEIINFALIVGFIVLAYTFVNYLNSYFSHILFFDKVFIRTNAFFEILSNKAMATGYENIEFEKGREKLMKAVGAIEVNRVGVELLLQVFPIFITSIAGILLYSSYILTINFTIVLVLLGMAAMNLLLNAYARKYEERTQGELNTYRTKLKYYQDEANKLSNAKDIRIYKLEKWFYNGIKLFTNKFSTTVMKQKMRYAFASLSDSVFSIIRNLIAYTILVTMVLSGTINVAEFTFMIGIVIGFAVWLNQLSESYGRLKEASIRINHFRDYMDIDEDINMDEGEAVEPLLNKKLSIEFKNVSFTYPKAEQPTISNLNLKIEPGEKLALVGVNGAGKTTLVKLLTGLYNPTEGKILINGQPVDSFNRYDYYKLFGVIFQDINTLPFTIAENISGRAGEDTDYQRVNNVLEQAGLKEKVSSLEMKEHTNLTQVIDDKGIMLSGGELQKLMLARALYKDSPILVLDEPTAALDPLAEQALYLKYNSLTENKTSLFISHRLSSTQFCNKIIYLEDGTILETGSHKELMKKNGKYFKMFEIQSQYYKENKQEGSIDETTTQSI
ncbi:Lipid A export ATP-binding/permease protein MsbA [Candidatus Izimaplasma bacterium HR1]|jgi:ABC-type multidrug transport system fused ATPase/permease subunit|uniref:ABC transporter ATP-binding protein n=1 Tax=Candidatus Izimoplasma sp. HR1 TaxID=1541959 RepID=UPI0004F75204|nr:Lipid A export ATP-binding/permease protein MsbA [Candidatus Izimaplasma bacterium HR1]